MEDQIVATLAGVAVAALGAVAAYFSKANQTKATEIAQHVEDKNYQQTVISDLVGFVLKAVQANADGKITQEEYDKLMEDGKAMAVKLTGELGLDITPILQILTNVKPKTP